MASARRDGLLALFRIQPHEAERVAMMLLLSLVSVGGIVITGQIAGRSLFLSALPPSAIPLRFILPPLLLVAATVAYTRRLGGARDQQVIPAALVSLAGLVLLARLLIVTSLRGDRLFLLALFSLLEIAASLSMILFWTVAGNLFDAREARRLFGLISLGSAIANVSFGLALGEMARRLAPEDLMGLVVLSLLASAGIVRRLARRYPAPERSATGSVTRRSPPAPGSTTQRGMLDDLRESLSSPLVRTLAGTVVLIALVANVTDYQLDLALKQSFGNDAGSMVSFLARLRLFAGVGAFAVQIFLAGRFLERFGVLPALLMLPFTVCLGSLGIVIWSAALWAVAVPRAADVALKYSVNDSAFNLLYLPLAAEARSRAKALIDGVLKPPVVATLGLVFLFLDRFARLSVVQWSYVVLVLVASWMLLLLLAERRYVAALAHSISLRRFDATLEGIAFSDETSRRVLAEALRDPSPAKVIHALTLLKNAKGVDWGEHVQPLLGHESAEVRAAALELLCERPVSGLVESLAACMEDPVASVREAAIRAYGRVLGVSAVHELSNRLSDPDPIARGAAVIALVQHGGLAGFLHAGGPLHAMLGHSDPAERREGARVLGLLGVPSFYHPLLELISDPDRSVRLSAIQAAARIAAPELKQALSQAAGDPALRRPALQALLSCAGGDPAALASLLDDPARPRDLRCQAARSLQRLGERSGPYLLRALDEPDDAVRGAVISSLLSMRENGSRLAAPSATFSARLDAELRIAFDRWLLLQDLASDRIDASLLVGSAERALARDDERVLDLLCLVSPELPGPSLRDALTRGDARRRADAVELIDSVASASRALVVPALAGTAAQRLEVAERRLGLKRVGGQARLRALAASPDAWWRACAVDAAGRCRIALLRDLLEAALQDPSPLVSSAAGVALSRLPSSALSSPASQESLPMPLVPLEQILFLKQVPLFRDIPAEEIAGLLPIVEEAWFEAGATIIQQGDAGDGLFIVVEGQIAIDVDGQRRPGRIGPKDVIGELAILTGEPRAATCTAETEVVALHIRREPFWELMREHPEVSLGVIRILVTHLRRDQGAASPGPTRAA